MNSKILALSTSLAAIMFIPSLAVGKSTILAQNYDGTNHFTCAWYAAGNYSDAYRSVAAKFNVAGNGKLALKRMVLPYRNSLLQANPKNYALSIVQDHIYWPVGRVVWSGTPQLADPTTDNYDHPLHGTVEGGKDYWVTFEPIALDNRYFAWSFATAPIPNCGPMFPQDSDWVAFRASSSGPSTDEWVIRSAQIRPAFLIEGDPLPKAEFRVSPLFQFPGNTNLLVIASDNVRAQVILDGSESSDPDNDPLQFSWFDGHNSVATAVLPTVGLETGSHQISLVVGDGVGEDAKTMTLNVITPAHAVSMLSKLFNDGGWLDRDKQLLGRFLNQAEAAFSDSNFKAGKSRLVAFQTLVRARLIRDDQGAASLLNAIAQEIVAVLGDR